MVESEQAAYLAQVERILASKEFGSSRQLRDFLRYVTRRALEGTEHLDQSEIAASVLGKPADFNPLDDASVRKLASMTRQRLEHYYAKAGAADTIVIALPVRSYLPEFHTREAPSPPEPVAPPPPARPGWVLPAVAAAALALAAGVALGRYWAKLDVPAAAQVVIRTAKGDLVGGSLDLPGDAIRLGPALRPRDQISVRMRFTPTMEAHQAGVMLWRNDNNYVKLGRRFMARNLIEFAAESRGAYSLSEGAPAPDPDGQSGEPIWLSLQREGQTVTAHTSRDGVHWRAIGAPITAGFDLTGARVALYAFHGRRDATPIDAAFDRVLVGANFGLWPRDESGVAGFDYSSRCEDSASAAVADGLLRLRIDSSRGSCTSTLTRPLQGGDWTLRTHLDFLPVAGASAGILVRGEKASMRLARYFSNEPVISLIQDGRDFSVLRDYPGSPALTLRLECRNGTIAGSFSRDEVVWVQLPHKAKRSDLGEKLVAGPHLSTSPWGATRAAPPADFRWFGEEVATFRNFR